MKHPMRSISIISIITLGPPTACGLPTGAYVARVEHTASGARAFRLCNVTWRWTATELASECGLPDLAFADARDPERWCFLYRSHGHAYLMAVGNLPAGYVVCLAPSRSRSNETVRGLDGIPEAEGAAWRVVEVTPVTAGLAGGQVRTGTTAR